ncbi:MAG: hypothetical protein LBC18_06360 [Opitutaceae bacterium]|jgi:hypothetical protein|nr:hypothetical protein [Opitutaceae bacterium]
MKKQQTMPFLRLISFFLSSQIPVAFAGSMPREISEAGLAWAALAASIPKKGIAVNSGNSPMAAHGLDHDGPAAGARARQTPDWNAIMAGARNFHKIFPNDQRAAEARKIEMMALLSVRASAKNRLSRADRLEIDAYLADTTMPDTDRFEVSAGIKNLELQNAGIKTWPDSLRMRTGHARALMQEFPDDHRGYGYLLSLGRSSDSSSAKQIAVELIHSPAPEKIRQSAQSLLDQRTMEGKPLKIDGIDMDRFKGKFVIVYSWTIRRPAFLGLIKRLASLPETDFAGINIDEDAEAAAQFARLESLPGEQYYDGGGRDGPLASLLRFQLPTSVYLVDKDGILLDTLGHTSTFKKLSRLVGATGKNTATPGNGGGR